MLAGAAWPWIVDIGLPCTHHTFHLCSFLQLYGTQMSVPDAGNWCAMHCALDIKQMKWVHEIAFDVDVAE